MLRRYVYRSPFDVLVLLVISVVDSCKLDLVSVSGALYLVLLCAVIVVNMGRCIVGYSICADFAVVLHEGRIVGVSICDAAIAIVLYSRMPCSCSSEYCAAA